MVDFVEGELLFKFVVLFARLRQLRCLLAKLISDQCINSILSGAIYLTIVLNFLMDKPILQTVISKSAFRSSYQFVFRFQFTVQILDACLKQFRRFLEGELPFLSFLDLVDGAVVILSQLAVLSLLLLQLASKPFKFL